MQSSACSIQHTDTNKGKCRQVHAAILSKTAVHCRRQASGLLVISRVGFFVRGIYALQAFPPMLRYGRACICQLASIYRLASSEQGSKGKKAFVVVRVSPAPL